MLLNVVKQLDIRKLSEMIMAYETVGMEWLTKLCTLKVGEEKWKYQIYLRVCQ